MAIKDFVLNDSYTKIEHVFIDKKTKRVEYRFTTYKDSVSKEEIISNSIIVDNTDAIIADSITAEFRETIPAVIAKDGQYDIYFGGKLKTETNIIGACYTHLKTRSEFINTKDI